MMILITMKVSTLKEYNIPKSSTVQVMDIIFTERKAAIDAHILFIVYAPLTTDLSSAILPLIKNILKRSIHAYSIILEHICRNMKTRAIKD